MDRVESGLRLILKYQEAFNRRDVAALAGLLTDDCVFETADPAPDGLVLQGKREVVPYLEGFFQRSPESFLKVEEVFGLGLRSVLRWRLDWVDAEGIQRHARGADLFQLRNGFLSEKFSYTKG